MGDKEIEGIFDLISSSIEDLYYAVYHIWLKQKTFACVKGEILETKDIIGMEGDYVLAWNTYVKTFIMPEYQAAMYEFGNITTLASRLHDTDTISMVADRRDLGWIRVQFIVEKRDEEGNAVNLVLIVRNINEEITLKKQKMDAEFAAEHDPLTGLYNRKGFDRISRSEEFKNAKTGFVLFDIDNFKALNDCYGHDMGDQVLITIADVMKQIFREDDKLFRLGGDELAVLLHHCDEHMWNVVCKKIQDVHIALKKAFSEGLSTGVTLSAGLCFSENGYNASMHLFADEALYETKRNGRAGCSMIDQNHKILHAWRDETVTSHMKNSLEYSISGMYRIEVSIEKKFPSRLICGEAMKLAFGVPMDAAPEECYQIWRKGIDPEYEATLEETMQFMLEGGQAECTYRWFHPELGEIYVRSNGFAEVKDECMIFTGYHHVLKDTKLIEKQSDKDLILKTLSDMYLGMYYLNLEFSTFSVFQMTLSEDYLELSPMKLDETTKNFISKVVNPDDREKMTAFMQMDTLQERLKDDKYIDCEYRSVPLKCWCRARLIPVKYDVKKKLVGVLFTVAQLDKDKTQEMRESMAAALSASNLHSYEYDPVAHTGICFTEKNFFGLPKYIENYPDSLGDMDLFHPEDIYVFLQTAHQMDERHERSQCDVRIKRNGKYNWYSCIFDPYFDPEKQYYVAILTVIDISLRMASLKSYEDRLHSLLATEENRLSMCTINLTQNTFDMIDSQEIMEQFIDKSMSVDDVFMKTADSIVDTELQREYREKFNREYLLKLAADGNMHVQMEYLIKLSEKHYEWVTAVIDMAQNPITGEITGVAYCCSIQKQRMSKELLEVALKQDYLFAAVIFTDTDEFYLYNSANGEFSERMSDYWGVALTKAKHHCEKRVYDYLKEIFTKEVILKYLESAPEYIYVFNEQYNGEKHRLEIRFRYMDESQTMILASMRNITDLSLLEQFRHESEHDPLTDLYNRKTVFRKSCEMLDTYPHEQFAMVHVDMKHFRLYNTFFGDKAGDELLCEIANLLRLIAKDYDHMVYGRIEADVFCVFFPYDQKKFQDHLKMGLQYFKKYRVDFYIEPAVGLYFVSDRGMSMEAMFTRATLAAKEVQTNSPYATVVYDEKLEKALNVNQQILNEMQTAIDEEQFQVYLQPKYSLRTNKMVGAEALVRWHHPTRGIISPASFIPIFERNGFITVLDHYMWEHVCQLLRKWKEEGKPLAPVSVNVSRLSMFGTSTVEFLKELVQKYEIDPKYLELELTESAYMDDPEEMKTQMIALREAGFTILMDDFGSGYSSLNALRELPVDVLKLDMKFLSLDSQDIRGGLVISSIVRMSKLLNLIVIAEGVETQEQADYLKGIGCEYVQGFLFARPMPMKNYEQMLTNSGAPLSHVNQPVIGHIGRIIAETGSGTYAMGTVIPVPLACIEYADHDFVFLRVNPEFYTEFELTDDLEPETDVFKRKLSEKSYSMLIQAFEESIKTGKKTQTTILWNSGDGTKHRYVCRIAYEGNIGVTAAIVVVFVNITDW